MFFWKSRKPVACTGSFLSFFARYDPETGLIVANLDGVAKAQDALKMVAALAAMVICEEAESMHPMLCRMFGEYVAYALEKRKSNAGDHGESQ